MKNIFLFTLSILFISNITLSQDGRIVLDKVAAQIGDKIILSSEIEISCFPSKETNRTGPN